MKYTYLNLHAPHPRRWTKTAITCYLRGCICEGCPVKAVMDTLSSPLSRICKMKHSVLESVRVLGKPEGLTERKFLLEEK